MAAAAAEAFPEGVLGRRKNSYLPVTSLEEKASTPIFLVSFVDLNVFTLKPLASASGSSSGSGDGGGAIKA